MLMFDAEGGSIPLFKLTKLSPVTHLLLTCKLDDYVCIFKWEGLLGMINLVLQLGMINLVLQFTKFLTVIPTKPA